MKPERTFTTRADLGLVAATITAPTGPPPAIGHEHPPAVINEAMNRFAWAVKDLRALGLAGRWNVRLQDGETSAAVVIDFNSDALAHQASDAIWGDMK